jgi:hypothetical protein
LHGFAKGVFGSGGRSQIVSGERFNSTAPILSASWIAPDSFLIVGFLFRSHEAVRLVFNRTLQPPTIEILIGLPHGKRCVRSEQLVAEDLG